MKTLNALVIAMYMTCSLQAQQKTNEKMKNYTTDSVISKDGTKIGYRQMGRGPGLIILHGTFESAQSHMEFAEALSDSFTVYMPDRRGRGTSSYSTQEFKVEKDIEDLVALMQKTNSHYVFAVSAGGVIALKAALVFSGIEKLAIWEAPLIFDSIKGYNMLNKYDNELSSGKTADAMVTAMKGGKFAGSLFTILPRFILRGFTNKMMKGEESKATKDDVTMRMLAPTIHHDFKLTLDNLNNIPDFKNIKAQTLLVGGVEMTTRRNAKIKTPFLLENGV
jgi:pimeloyl-ACP methyl ester carboxylesterase